MSGSTTELNLKTAVDSDDTADYLTLSLADSLRTMDALFNSVTGHNHSAAHQGGPITTLPISAIADGSITGTKIADGSIGTADLADLSVTTNKHADLSVTTPKLADGAVTTAKILDRTIQAVDIAVGAVTTTEIADGTITGTDIADASIPGTKLVPSSVGSVQIADGNITSAKIADGTIVNGDIADGTIDQAKLSTAARLRYVGQYWGATNFTTAVSGSWVATPIIQALPAAPPNKSYMLSWMVAVQSNTTPTIYLGLGWNGAVQVQVAQFTSGGSNWLMTLSGSVELAATSVPSATNVQIYINATAGSTSISGATFSSLTVREIFST